MAGGGGGREGEHWVPFWDTLQSFKIWTGKDFYDPVPSPPPPIQPPTYGFASIRHCPVIRRLQVSAVVELQPVVRVLLARVHQRVSSSPSHRSLPSPLHPPPPPWHSQLSAVVGCEPTLRVRLVRVHHRVPSPPHPRPLLALTARRCSRLSACRAHPARTCRPLCLPPFFITQNLYCRTFKNYKTKIIITCYGYNIEII